MSLINVSNSGGILTAITNTGQAISETRVQQLVDTDYTKVENLKVIHKLWNIGTKKALVDTLIDKDLIEGEVLLIRKADNTYHEFTVPVAGLTPAPSLYTKLRSSDSYPDGNIYTNAYDNANPPWHSMDSNETGTYGECTGTGGWLKYRTENDIPVTIAQVRFRVLYAREILFQGSNNGVEWTTLETITGLADNVTHDITRTVTTPGSYFYYRAYVSSGQTTTTRFYCWDMFVDGFSVDTSSVTAGEVPNRVYRMQDIITMNEVQAVEDKAQRTYRYGYDGQNVKVYAKYPIIDFTANRNLITKIDFKQELNQIVEMTGEIYAMTYVQANDNHTSLTTPSAIGTMAISGADAASAPDAWKLMDGDFLNTAITVPTGVGGVVDLIITYTFVNPTIVYATKIAYAAATQSLADFKVEGSNDGTNWDLVYDKVGQGLTVDNLIITKAVDTFGEYTQYRISFTKGATENDNIILKEFALMTEQL